MINETIGMTSEEIWEKYHDMIYKVAHTQAVKFNISMEEMVSEAAALIWSTLDRFNPEKGKLSTFIYQQAYYACLELGCQKNKHLSRYSNETAMSSEDDGSAFFDAQPAEEGFIDALRKNVSPKAQQLLDIFHEAPEELSEWLTVKRKVSGRRTLRAYMIDVCDWTSTEWILYSEEIAEYLRTA